MQARCQRQMNIRDFAFVCVERKLKRINFSLCAASVLSSQMGIAHLQGLGMTVINTATGLGPGWGLLGWRNTEDSHPPCLTPAQSWDPFTILFFPVGVRISLALNFQAYESHPRRGRDFLCLSQVPS